MASKDFAFIFPRVSLQPSRPPKVAITPLVRAIKKPEPPPKETSKAQSKTTRRSNLKSKSGCSICKLKHYKCDEIRPSCSRCVKAGWTCEYKPVSKRARPNTSASILALAPKNALVPIKTNPVDGNYLQYANSLFNHNPVASFQIPLWSLLLQLAQNEPCIRHITIATAMMHHISAGGYQDPRNLERQQMFQAGLKHYVDSVRVLQKILARANGNDDKATWEISLLASYLFTSFESLMGNEEGAHDQMESGLKLMKNALQKFDFDAEYSGNLEEIAYAFNRLDLTTSTYEAGYDTKALLKPHVPDSFRNMTHAKHVLEAIIPNILALIRRPIQEPNVTGTYPTNNIPAEISVKLAELAGILHKWNDNMDKLTAEIGLDLSAPAFGPLNIRARSSHHVLMNQYWMCFVWLKTAFSPTQMVFDPFLPIFEEITRLAELIIAMQPERQCIWKEHKYYYTSETPFIHPLFYTAQKCRDGRLRRRALHLLKLAGKEGVSEGRSSAAAAEWIVEQEEQGLPDGVIGSVDPKSGGYIEERWRLRGANLGINRMASSLEITCTRIGLDGMEEVVKGHATWERRCAHHRVPAVLGESKQAGKQVSFFG